MPWLYQFVLLTVLTVKETICPKIWAKLLPKIAKSPFPVDVRDEDVIILLSMINFLATWLKISGEMTFGRLDRKPIQGNGSKKLEFQLVLWASISHIFLSRGHLLLVLVYVFVRWCFFRWLSWGKWALKVITCPAMRKSTCPRLLDGNFFESSLRSSSLPTYSCRFLLAKSKTCTLGGASLKEWETY